MEMDALRAELELLFELDDLFDISRQSLGLDPEVVGGTATKGSFVRALTAHCADHGAIEALCDAAVAAQPDASAELGRVPLLGLGEEQPGPGASLGEFDVVRKLGEGPTGVTYEATRGDQQYRVKLLHRACCHDVSALNRYLTYARISGAIEHPGLPQDVTVDTFNGRRCVVHRYQEGVSLRERLEVGGAMHPSEAEPIVTALLSALGALHEGRLAHGNLKLENVLIAQDDAGTPQIQLQDAGTDRLVSKLPANGHPELLCVGTPKTIAPEVIQGGSCTPASDIYSVGVVLYELLTGNPPFTGDSSLHLAIAHLTEEAVAPSDVAPRGNISAELDEFLLSLLEKSPQARPADAAEALAAFQELKQRKSRRPSISVEDLDERLDALEADPTNQDAALAVEAAAEEGGDQREIAESLKTAFGSLDATIELDPKLDVGFRAGRMFRAIGDSESAEAIYAELLALDPGNVVALTALEDLRKSLGHHEELIEQWLGQADESSDASLRAQAMAKIGQLYESQLGDSEQAVVAFTQALCEDPANPEYAERIARLLGNDKQGWGDVLAACSETLQGERSHDEKLPLFALAGQWYAEKLQRYDLALASYQAILASDAASEVALDGLTQIYKKAQQFDELAKILQQRADAAPTPNRARDLRAEAAHVLDTRLGDAVGARAAYEQILEDDPTHETATERLGGLLQRSGDHEGYARLLRQRAEAARGPERISLLNRAAEALEDHLGAAPEALEAYRQITAEDPSDLRALRGMDRLYSKLGQYDELLENLEQQASVAATPRQKISLRERMAAVYAEEFLEPSKASVHLEAILELDPKNDGALTELARMYRLQDRWQDLSKLYERHLDCVEDESRKVTLWLAQARVLGTELGEINGAIEAYENALALAPDHGEALKALAELRESQGDAAEALRAVEALAAGADDPREKAQHYLRAATILKERGDLAAAIDRYKLAREATPDDSEINIALRAALVEAGDTEAVAELLEREIDATDGDARRAALAAELARIALNHQDDPELAERNARRALTWDGTATQAHAVMGQLAFNEERFVEAANHYEKIVGQLDALPSDYAIDSLVNYIDSLIRSGNSELAVTPVTKLREIAPDDGHALQRVAAVTFEHGDPEQARPVLSELLERFDGTLTSSEHAVAVYRYAETLRRCGELDQAEELLEDASDLDPRSTEPLISLTKVFEASQRWEDVWQTKTRLLDLVEGDERVAVLIEMGELAVGKLDDRTRATKSLVAALEERPDDRKLLTRLMQLYSEEKDWSKLVDVVLKLADFVEDPKQKAKYLLTAGMVNRSEIGDEDNALSCFERVLELDPGQEKAAKQSVQIYLARGDHDAAERLLRRKVRAATEAQDTEQVLVSFTQLGNFYRDIGRLEDAVESFEAAHTVDPDDRQHLETLAELYASAPDQYLDKAVKVQGQILASDPYRADAYKALRTLYTETKNADGAWCLCQALYVLRLAEPDEERFFKRMRSEEPAYAQEALSDDDWRDLLYHDQLDSLLSAIFSVVEPAVRASVGEEFVDIGYDPKWAVDLAQHPQTIGQTLNYAAGVLSVPLPVAFENTNDPGGLAFLGTRTPALSIGLGALNADVSSQAMAFLSGHHLAYHHGGFIVRQLIGTGTGLKAWLFAAIKLISPQFPVAASLEGAVNEHMAVLQNQLSGVAKEELARGVSKLLEAATSLDLKSWIAAVDLTADRAGFLLAHDLETAVELIRQSEGSNTAAAQQRVKELVRFAISPEYLRLRERLEVHLAT